MTPVETRIISIGYEGRSIDEFAADLASQGTETLIDVRLNAISRKPGFSKRALQSALEQHGINYLHIRELGNPRENREEFRHGKRRAIEKYRRVVDSFHEQLAVLAHECKGQTIAILCFEADHSTCHRRIVIERIGELIPGAIHSTATG